MESEGERPAMPALAFEQQYINFSTYPEIEDPRGIVALFASREGEETVQANKLPSTIRTMKQTLLVIFMEKECFDLVHCCAIPWIYFSWTPRHPERFEQEHTVQ
jgi:hypothetical protein